MNARFSGTVALVAGGTGALGRAVSLEFQKEGAQVVVTYRKPEEFDLLRNAANTGGSSLEGHRIDVTDEAAVSELIESIAAKHGHLDALVNTVGGYAGGIKLWEMDTDVLERMLALNLRSGYALSRATVLCLTESPLIAAGDARRITAGAPSGKRGAWGFSTSSYPTARSCCSTGGREGFLPMQMARAEARTSDRHSGSV
jgi:NAD(P)-dependent dehydrogenase (short-subunit alcohol dehydrogenase family)